MRLLAIDYGEKRVGIASTDDTGQFALPRTVLPNDADLVGKILELKEKEGVERVILGESKNLDQTPNPIQARIEELKIKLEEAGVEVVLHPEIYTSMEADRLQGNNAMHDASAAALILKSYIDTARD
jgi:putative Holliday junction resolvase